MERSVIFVPLPWRRCDVIDFPLRLRHYDDIPWYSEFSLYLSFLDCIEAFMFNMDDEVRTRAVSGGFVSGNETNVAWTDNDVRLTDIEVHYLTGW